MNILLINTQLPKFLNWKDYYIPSSLLYLASAIQKNCVNYKNVDILDLNTFKIENKTDDENTLEIYNEIITNKILDFKPSIIGITSLFSGQFNFVSYYSNKIKEKFSNIKIMIGGIHPTTFPYEILTNYPSIDYIIIGEGDESTVDLIDAIESDNIDDELMKIDGIAYRKNSNIIIRPKTKFISNLDKLPFPSYDKIKIEDYYYEDTSNWHNPKNLPIKCSIPIITSRGCPNKCNFCSVYIASGHKYRMVSAKKVVDEIEYCYKNYNHRHFSFMDDNLTFNKNHILDICNEIIKRNLNIQFEVPSGLSVNTLDKEVIDALVSAGLVRVPLAIESGSDYIRNKVMRKNLSNKKIYEVVNEMKKYKQLYIKAFFIIGMPEETTKSLWDTYDMIKEIDIDKPLVTNIRPYYGTNLFEQCVKDNLLTDSVDLNDMRKTEDLYYANSNHFYIKSYNLELKELYKFREIFDELIKESIEKSNKKRLILS